MTKLEERVLAVLAAQNSLMKIKKLEKGTVSKPDGVYTYEVIDYDGTAGFVVTDPQGEQYEDQGGGPNSPRTRADVIPHVKRLIDNLSKRAHMD